MNKPTRLFVLLCAAAPALMGAKCIDYDPRFGGLTGGAVDAGAPPPGGFVPAVACDVAKTAKLDVSGYKFNIRCGCAETSGKVCTIQAGTRITWQFADTTEHNVASSMSLFGASGEKLTGPWDHTFETAGTYRYSCSIHPQDMGGYRIEVIAAN